MLMSVSAFKVVGILAFGPGISMFIGGLLLVATGQATRSLLDNTNYTRQILELMEKDD